MSTSAGRVLLMPKGEYDSSVTYTMLDMVRYNNVTYVCKKTTTGNAPDASGDNEWWQLVARGSSVIGVKGDAEDTYRDGNVNITPANIGILPFSGSTAPIGGTSIPPVGLDDAGKFLKASGGWANLPLFQGVSGSILSVSGMLPPAALGDEDKSFMGDGTWKDLRPLEISASSINALPVTINNASITADMKCKPGDMYLSNPAAQTGEWTITTATGSVTISGTINGTTDITLWLTTPRAL